MATEEKAIKQLEAETKEKSHSDPVLKIISNGWNCSASQRPKKRSVRDPSGSGFARAN